MPPHTHTAVTPSLVVAGTPMSCQLSRLCPHQQCPPPTRHYSDPCAPTCSQDNDMPAISGSGDRRQSQGGARGRLEPEPGQGRASAGTGLGLWPRREPQPILEPRPRQGGPQLGQEPRQGWSRGRQQRGREPRQTTLAGARAGYGARVRGRLGLYHGTLWSQGRARVGATPRATAGEGLKSGLGSRRIAGQGWSLGWGWRRQRAPAGSSWVCRQAQPHRGQSSSNNPGTGWSHSCS